MNANKLHGSERRREILAEIGQIPVVIAGTLTTRQRRRGKGQLIVHHQLQRWMEGRNNTRHVPSDRVPAVHAGVEGYRRVQTLIDELARLDEATALATNGDSKKKPTTR